MNLYLFSGLGADDRVFESLDFGEIEPKVVEWISPEKDGRLEKYTKRLQPKINLQGEILC